MNDLDLRMRRFLSDLLSASEKAAHIARACRKEKDLFQLLIEVSFFRGLLGLSCEDCVIGNLFWYKDSNQCLLL